MPNLDSPDVVTKGGQTKRDWFEEKQIRHDDQLTVNGPYRMLNSFTGSIPTPEPGVNLDISLWSNRLEISENYEPSLPTHTRFRIMLDGVEQPEAELEDFEISWPELPANEQRRQAGEKVLGSQRRIAVDIKEDTRIEIFERETGRLLNSRIAAFRDEGTATEG